MSGVDKRSTVPSDRPEPPPQSRRRQSYSSESSQSGVPSSRVEFQYYTISLTRDFADCDQCHRSVVCLSMGVDPHKKQAGLGRGPKGRQRG